MLENLGTEKRNDRTKHIDEMTSLGFVQVMNEEDQNVALAVKQVLPQIAKAIDSMCRQYKAGGRIIYLGAGTSGRLGILDAVECVPTFGVAFDEFIGLIAGGDSAIIKAVEGAEDSEEFGVADLKGIHFTNKDVLIGLAASGRTPYVLAALKYAGEIGAATIAVACNKNSLVGAVSQIAIEVDCGPEVLTGSTRLKAGTAQKLVLNMLSTGMMVQSGKVYGNLMVDVKPTNLKLVERSKTIIMDATNCSYETANEFFEKSNQSPKTAIVMIEKKCGYEEAVTRLAQADGFISKALK